MKSGAILSAIFLIRTDNYMTEQRQPITQERAFQTTEIVLSQGKKPEKAPHEPNRDSACVITQTKSEIQISDVAARKTGAKGEQIWELKTEQENDEALSIRLGLTGKDKNGPLVQKDWETDLPQALQRLGLSTVIFNAGSQQQDTSAIAMAAFLSYLKAQHGVAVNMPKEDLLKGAVKEIQRVLQEHNKRRAAIEGDQYHEKTVDSLGIVLVGTDGAVYSGAIGDRTVFGVDGNGKVIPLAEGKVLKKEERESGSSTQTLDNFQESIKKGQLSDTDSTKLFVAGSYAARALSRKDLKGESLMQIGSELSKTTSSKDGTKEFKGKAVGGVTVERQEETKPEPEDTDEAKRLQELLANLKELEGHVSRFWVDDPSRGSLTIEEFKSQFPHTYEEVKKLIIAAERYVDRQTMSDDDYMLQVIEEVEKRLKWYGDYEGTNDEIYLLTNRFQLDEANHILMGVEVYRAELSQDMNNQTRDMVFNKLKRRSVKGEVSHAGEPAYIEGYYQDLFWTEDELREVVDLAKKGKLTGGQKREIVRDAERFMSRLEDGADKTAFEKSLQSFAENGIVDDTLVDLLKHGYRHEWTRDIDALTLVADPLLDVRDEDGRTFREKMRELQETNDPKLIDLRRRFYGYMIEAIRYLDVANRYNPKASENARMMVDLQQALRNVQSMSVDELIGGYKGVSNRAKLSETHKDEMRQYLTSRSALLNYALKGADLMDRRISYVSEKRPVETRFYYKRLIQSDAAARAYLMYVGNKRKDGSEGGGSGDTIGDSDGTKTKNAGREVSPVPSTVPESTGPVNEAHEILGAPPDEVSETGGKEEILAAPLPAYEQKGSLPPPAPVAPPREAPPPPPRPQGEPVKIKITVGNDMHNIEDVAKGAGVEHQLQLTQQYHGALDNVPVVGWVSRGVKNAASGFWQRSIMSPLFRNREERWRTQVMASTGMVDLPDTVVDKAMEKGREATRKRNFFRRQIDRVYNLGANIVTAQTTDEIEAKKWMQEEYKKALNGNTSELAAYLTDSIAEKEAFAGRLENKRREDVRAAFEHFEEIPDGPIKDQLMTDFFEIASDYLNNTDNLSAEELKKREADLARRLYQYASSEGLTLPSSNPDTPPRVLRLSNVLGEQYKSFDSRLATVGTTMMRAARYLRENKTAILADAVLNIPRTGTNPNWQESYRQGKLTVDLRIGIGVINEGARVETNAQKIESTAQRLRERNSKTSLSARHALLEGSTLYALGKTVFGNELVGAYVGGMIGAGVMTLLPTDMKKLGIYTTAVGIPAVPVLIATSVVGLPLIVPAAAGVAIGAGVVAGVKEFRRLRRERKAIEYQASVGTLPSDEVKLNLGMGARALGFIYGTSSRQKMYDEYIKSYQRSADDVLNGMLSTALFADKGENALASEMAADLLTMPLERAVEEVKKALRFASEAKARSDLSLESNRRLFTFSKELSESRQLELLDEARRQVVIRLEQLFQQRPELAQAFTIDRIPPEGLAIVLHQELANVYISSLKGDKDSLTYLKMVSDQYQFAQKGLVDSLVEERAGLAARDKAFNRFRIRKGLHRFAGVAGTSYIMSVASGLVTHQIESTPTVSHSSNVIDYKGFSFRPPKGFTYNADGTLTGNGHSENLAHFVDPTDKHFKFDEFQKAFGIEQERDLTIENFVEGKSVAFSLAGSNSRIYLPWSVGIERTISSDGKHELIKGLFIRGQRIGDFSTDPLDPNSHEDLVQLQEVLEKHHLQVDLTDNPPPFSGEMIDSSVTDNGTHTDVVLSLPKEVEVIFEKGTHVADIRINDTTIILDKDINLGTPEGIKEFSKILESKGIHVNSNVDDPSAISINTEIIYKPDESVIEKLSSPVDHKEFYAYNTIESNDNELDLHTYYDKNTNTFYFNATSMGDAYQIAKSGSIIGGANPPYINVPQLIHEKQENPATGPELGIYVYPKGDPNNGYFIPDSADGKIDGQVALQAGDVTHKVITPNGEVTLGQVRQLLINEKGLQDALGSPQAQTIPNDGRINLATELNGFQNVYNGTNGDQTVIQFGRMTQIEGKPVFQSFAAIEGSDTQPGPIMVPSSVTTTSYQYVIDTSVPESSGSILRAVSEARDVYSFSTPGSSSESATFTAIPLVYSQYADVGKQSAAGAPRYNPLYRGTVTKRSSVSATGTEGADQLDAIDIDKIDERSTAITIRITELQEQLEEENLLPEDKKKFEQEVADLNYEMFVINAVGEIEDFIMKGTNGTETLTDEQLVQFLRENSALGITTLDQLTSVRKNPKERRKIIAKLIAEIEKKKIVARSYQLKREELEKDIDTFPKLFQEAVQRALNKKKFTPENMDIYFKNQAELYKVAKYQEEFEKKNRRQMENADRAEMLTALNLTEEQLTEMIKVAKDNENIDRDINDELTILIREKYPDIEQNVTAQDATRLAKIEKIVEECAVTVPKHEVSEKLQSTILDIDIPQILHKTKQPENSDEAIRILEERSDRKREQLSILHAPLLQRGKKPRDMNSDDRMKAMLWAEFADVYNGLPAFTNHLYPHYGRFFEMALTGEIRTFPAGMIQGIDLERLKTDVQYRIDSFFKIYKNGLEEDALDTLLHYQGNYEELMMNAKQQALQDKSISTVEIKNLEDYERAQADSKVFEDNHPLRKKTGPWSDDERNQYAEDRRNFDNQLATKYGYTSYDEMYKLQSKAKLKLKRKIIQMTKSEDLLQERTEHYIKLWRTVLADVEFSNATIFTSEVITPEQKLGSYKVSGGTDVGKKRGEKGEQNEDNYGIKRYDDLGITFMIVADGIGGHTSGEEASKKAVQIAQGNLFGIYYDGAYKSGINRGETEEEARKQAMQTALKEVTEQANAAIHEMNVRDNKNSGSTVVAVVVADDGFYVAANVGDSRAVKPTASGIVRITKDNSNVQDLIDQGLLTEAQRRTDPRRNQVTRSLGDSSGVEVDMYTGTLLDGEKMLLMSDGVWEMIDDVQLNTLAGAGGPESVVRTIIKTANDNGGADNITILVAQKEAGITPPKKEKEPANAEEFVQMGIELIREGRPLDAINHFRNKKYADQFGVYVSTTGTSRLADKNPSTPDEVLNFSHNFAKGCWFRPPRSITYASPGIRNPDNSFLPMEQWRTDVLYELALVSAEEWIHFLQNSHGSLTGQADHEVDAAAYLISQRVEPSLPFMLRYDRAQMLGLEHKYSYDDSLVERPAFRRGTFVTIPGEKGYWQIVGFNNQNRNAIVQSTTHAGGTKEIPYQEFADANEKGVYPFKDITSFDQLYSSVQQLQNVWGYQEEFTASQIQTIVEGLRNGRGDINDVPRSGGLRQKVIELLGGPINMAKVGGKTTMIRSGSQGSLPTASPYVAQDHVVTRHEVHADGTVTSKGEEFKVGEITINEAEFMKERDELDRIISTSSYDGISHEMADYIAGSKNSRDYEFIFYRFDYKEVLYNPQVRLTFIQQIQKDKVERMLIDSLRQRCRIEAEALNLVDRDETNKKSNELYKSRSNREVTEPLKAVELKLDEWNKRNKYTSQQPNPYLEASVGTRFIKADSSLIASVDKCLRERYAIRFGMSGEENTLILKQFIEKALIDPKIWESEKLAPLKGKILLPKGKNIQLQINNDSVNITVPVEISNAGTLDFRLRLKVDPNTDFFTVDESSLENVSVRIKLAAKTMGVRLDEIPNFLQSGLDLKTLFIGGFNQQMEQQRCQTRLTNVRVSIHGPNERHDGKGVLVWELRDERAIEEAKKNSPFFRVNNAA